MLGVRKYLNEDNQLNLSEGEYGKNNEGIWYCQPFNYHGLGCLKNHEVIEHEDNTISVSPSILIYDNESKWHGHLIKGDWIKLDD